jgi:DNA-binding IclR family transcriptional regulator
MKLRTIEKGILLIRLLSEHPKGMALADISRKLATPKSSVHHMLSTFLEYDFVSQDEETKKYSLGSRFFEISSKMLQGIDIREIARKHLIQLNEKSGEIVQLYILRKGKLICIDKVGSPTGGLAISSFIGWTTDPHPSAAGKVLLSELSMKEILGIYSDSALRAYGKNTITDFNELSKELHVVRTQGYAIDDEEYYEGVRCVGAPIRQGGKIVASVSITGSIFTMTMKKITQNLIPMVTMTGEKISDAMIGIGLS